MSVPYIAQKFQHNAIGIVSLKDPTIIIDIYSVLFTKCDIKNALLNKVQADPSTGKYPDDTYEEQLSVYLDLTGVNPEYIPYITEHMYINGCPYAHQNDHKQPVAVFELDFEQFELPLLTIKFNEMNPDYTFKMKFVFEHKKTTNNRDIKAEDFILYHVPGAYDTDYKEEHGNVINTQRSSYMLLRTNPVLTGNIKMVCTTDGKMYLDTFKEHTHRSLSYRQYRKQLVGTDGNYPVDVFNVFSNLAPDILMNLDNDFLNAQKETVYTDIKDQYMTEYEYGVSENTDRLYDEDLKILAPLYIADNIPDYFIIFKADIDKIPNPASPESGIKINDSVITNSGGYLIDSEIAQAIYEQYPERYKDYINVSDIFRIMKATKIFDLRPNTRLGNYLEKYRQQCQQYANKSLMASFVPVIRPWRAGCMRPNVQQDSFTVHGISYQHGNFNKVQRYVPLFELNEQGKVDKQFSMAYRMAGLLHPNIINLEYMFNDPDATDFKSYNYFGLYLTENQVLSISHIINAYKDGIYEGVDTDGNPVNIKDKLNPMLSHADSNTRLFSISSQDKVSIIHNITEISSFIKSNIVNIPGSMIGSPAYTSVNHIPMASFLTIKFTDKIKAGEHFKIIRPIETTDLSQHCQVIELIASNDERLKRYKKQHGRYLNTTGVRNTEFYQLPFYVSEDDTISDQLKRIQDCIRMIDSFVYISSITSDAIAFASEEKNLAF